MPSYNDYVAYMQSIGMTPAALPAGVDPNANPQGLPASSDIVGIVGGSPVYVSNIGPPLSVPPGTAVGASYVPTAYGGSLAGFGSVSGGDQSQLSQLNSSIPGITDAINLAKGAQAKWESLPTWAQWAIIAAVVVGAAVLLSRLGVGQAIIAKASQLAAIGTIGKAVTSIFGGGGSAAAGPGGTIVGVVPAGWVAAWVANGVQFYRSPDGKKLGVMNNKGRWRQWTPKKPVVLYSTGTNSLRTMMKADKILAKESRALTRMIERHVTKKASEPKPPKLTVAQYNQIASEVRR